MDDHPLHVDSAPTGVEGVLAMAAADEEFARLLVEQREEALIASGVCLAPTERAVLIAASPAGMEQLVGSLDESLVSPERRAVLGRMAAAAVAALAVGFTGCSRKPAEDKYEDPLAGGPSPQPRPRARPDAAPPSQMRPANPFDLTGKPLANPKPDSPFQMGFGDGMKRPSPMKRPMSGSRSELTWGGFTDKGVRPDRPPAGSRPAVSMGHNAVKGPLDVAAARRVLRRRLYMIQYCYVRGVASNPKLKGTITATFVVAANGRVTYSKLASSLNHKATEACVKNALKRMVFPKHSTTSTVKVPFHFRLR